MRANLELQDPFLHEEEPKALLRRIDALQAAVKYIFVSGDDVRDYARNKERYLMEADPSMSPFTVAMLIVAGLPKKTQIELLSTGMPESPADVDKRLCYTEGFILDYSKNKARLNEDKMTLNINVNLTEVSSESNNSTGGTDHSKKEVLDQKTPRFITRKPLPIRQPHAEGKTASVARISSMITKCTEQTLDGRKIIPAMEVPDVLYKYHDDPEIGGHDPFWITYMKIVKHYYWPAMRRDIEAHVRKCEMCDKVSKNFPRQPEESLEHQIVSDQIFNDRSVQVTYTEFNGLNFITVSTQASLICKCVALERDPEADSAVRSLLEDNQFDDVRKISFQAKFMATRTLRKYLRQRKIQIASAINTEIHDVLWKLKRFMLCYPKFEGGNEACLLAAVKHHNWSQANRSETLKTRSLVSRSASAPKYLAFSATTEEVEESRRAATLPRTLPRREESSNTRSATMYNRKILDRL